MKIAFFHVGADLRLPTLMVASCKSAMPDALVTQLTDLKTPQVPLVDEIRRGDPNGTHFNPYRMTRYGELEDGEWLLLDTDVIVQKAVEPLFSENPTFDVAMYKRAVVPIFGQIPGFPELTTETFARWMPFNSGVIFCRKPAFFRAVVDRVEGYTPRWRDRWGDQMGIAATVRSNKYAIGELPSWFNYTPAAKDDPQIEQAYIVHYKGERKVWMT